jgi:hypothetical protein
MDVWGNPSLKRSSLIFLRAKMWPVFFSRARKTTP